MARWRDFNDIDEDEEGQIVDYSDDYYAYQQYMMSATFDMNL